MAKTSVIERDKKRQKIVSKYLKKREELKSLISKLSADTSVNYDELQEAYKKLRSMPRDASPVRLKNRCPLTGRPRGYYRRVGLGRNMFRHYAMAGEIPGLIKSSW
ncbi:30S ribosomal protein S14 [soil metagenome]